jgi:hypothetical protein
MLLLSYISVTHLVDIILYYVYNKYHTHAQDGDALPKKCKKCFAKIPDVVNFRIYKHDKCVLYKNGMFKSTAIV